MIQSDQEETTGVKSDIPVGRQSGTQSSQTIGQHVAISVEIREALQDCVFSARAHSVE